MKSINTITKIKNEFNENINSHVFLVETNDEESCLKDIKEIIKDIIAKDDEITRHQIDEENYLELIIVRKIGREIIKDQILELQDRLKLKPVLSNNLIYIITPADAMNEISANKLLKTIEEPNQNIIGFLITTNIDLLLPTIKSRCEIISMMYDDKESKEITDEVKEIAKNLIVAIEKKDHHAFYKAKIDEKSLKENARDIEKILKDYYNTACNLKSIYVLDNNIVSLIQKNNSYSELIKKTKHINKIFNKLSRSMNFDLLLESLFIELKDVK